MTQPAGIGVVDRRAVVPRTFAWSGEPRGERLRWFTSGLRNVMLDQGYTEVDGMLATVRERLDVQMKNIDSRLGVLEYQLELRRRTLQQEFIAADMAISQLNSQGGSLAGLANQYRLF